jgi:hypothetical protein
MNKTKIDQRINHVFNTFTAHDRESFGEDGLTFAPDAAVLKAAPAATRIEKGDRLLKILKRTFVFLPGAFYLFYGTISILSFMFLRDQPWAILVVFLIGSFMTIFGIGSLRNPKHLAIPVAIVAVAVAAFGVFGTLGNLGFVFKYGVYFFPLALIAAFLAKSWGDDRK